MEVGGQRHSPTALPLGKEAHYPFYRRSDGWRMLGAGLDGYGKFRRQRG
jgi:hypothetical protein